VHSAVATGHVLPSATGNGTGTVRHLGADLPVTEHAFDSNIVEVNLVWNQGFVWPAQEPMNQVNLTGAFLCTREAFR
jgi:hypothetical protein